MLACLAATLNVDATIRGGAEAQLEEDGRQPGFSPVLCRLLLDPHLDLGYRQLAAVLLSQHVKRHWSEGSKKYAPPTTPEADKAAVRQLLPRAIGDSCSKIRNSAAEALGAIGEAHKRSPHTTTLHTSALRALQRQERLPAVCGNAGPGDQTGRCGCCCASCCCA